MYATVEHLQRVHLVQLPAAAAPVQLSGAANTNRSEDKIASG
jgi:hypothetical protein